LSKPDIYTYKHFQQFEPFELILEPPQLHFAIDCNKDSSFKLINNEMSTGEISIPRKQASPVRGVKYQKDYLA